MFTSPSHHNLSRGWLSSAQPSLFPLFSLDLLFEGDLSIFGETGTAVFSCGPGYKLPPQARRTSTRTYSQRPPTPHEPPLPGPTGPPQKPPPVPPGLTYQDHHHPHDPNHQDHHHHQGLALWRGPGGVGTPPGADVLNVLVVVVVLPPARRRHWNWPICRERWSYIKSMFVYTNSS